MSTRTQAIAFRAYRRWLRRRFLRNLRVEAVADGFWLGVLDPDTLRAVDRAFYAEATEPVDGMDRRYADAEHVAQGLQPWEQEAMSALAPGASVVVTSAGAGREVHGLLALGYDAVGYEPNADLVMAGQQHLRDSRRLRGCEYDAFPPVEGPVDGVVIGWGSYMLVQQADARRALLRGAFDSLRPGGVILVSYFDRPRTPYFAVVRRIAGPLRRLRRRPPMSEGDALSPNFVHYFTEAEIRSDLECAGFQVISTARTPYGHSLARRA